MLEVLIRFGTQWKISLKVNYYSIANYTLQKACGNGKYQINKRKLTTK